MAKNERNWYDAMPAIGVEYNDGESKDGAITPTVWEGSAEDVAETGEHDVTTDVGVKPLDVSDLTAKEIEEKVESGELNAAEVYEAEKRGKQRKGVLEAYAPKE